MGDRGHGRTERRRFEKKPVHCCVCGKLIVKARKGGVSRCGDRGECMNRRTGRTRLGT